MKVLIAVEDELFGGKVADFVVHHRWPEGTIFKILHCIEWAPTERELQTTPELSEYVALQHTMAYKVTGAIKKILADNMPEAQIEETVTQGPAAQMILAIGEGWGADMMVLGSHGRKGIGLFFLGSVSQAVVSHASCSLMIVRYPDKVPSAERQSASAMASR